MQVEATQEDKDAVEDYLARHGLNGLNRMLLRDAFASHRQAAERRALESAAEVADAISDKAGDVWETYYDTHDQGRRDGADQVASAIRALIQS